MKHIWSVREGIPEACSKAGSVFKVVRAHAVANHVVRYIAAVGGALLPCDGRGEAAGRCGVCPVRARLMMIWVVVGCTSLSRIVWMLSLILWCGVLLDTATSETATCI